MDQNERDVLFFEGDCLGENLYNDYGDANETTYNALRLEAKIIEKSEISLE